MVGVRHVKSQMKDGQSIKVMCLVEEMDGVHLTAVIDCCDRVIVGWRLSKSGKSGVAAAVLEEGIRSRKVQVNSGLVLRSDNGLIERFFRNIKEECIWLCNFASRDEAFEKIGDWMEHYNEERPHWPNTSEAVTSRHIST